jgi:DNA-directed RNA polymerase-3 subunit RPC5
MQFSQLVTLLGLTDDTASLLRTVQQVAVLVQGNWVVRSDILYPKDTASSIGGVPAELMCRGRDYIVSGKQFLHQTNCGVHKAYARLATFPVRKNVKDWL